MAPFNVTSTLPTFSASALGGAQFLGYVCAVTVSPTNIPVSNAATGTNTQTDSTNAPFDEVQNLGTQLTITSTATGTNNTTNFALASKRGILYNLIITSIAATCTVRANVQEVDPALGNVVTLFTVSLDGSSLGTGSPIGTFAIQCYPGAAAAASNGGTNLFIGGMHPGGQNRLQVSITATASQGGANINYTLTAILLN